MLSLKRIFSDGMIMQRNTENSVSGKADSGAEVTVSVVKGTEKVFSASARADENGCWSAVIPSFSGSLEPYEIWAERDGERITVKDVYFGELFHISGQSNMELPMRRTYDPFGNSEKPEDNKYIREFRVPISCRFTEKPPSDDFKGGVWKKAVGSDIPDMSGTGYHFACDIFKRLDIPVGLINTSAGGAALESFMPCDMIRKYKIHDDFLEKALKDNYIDDTAKADALREREWHIALGNNDFGLVPSEDMKSCIVPCLTNELEGLEGFSGRLYFFKEIDIPDDFPRDDAQLILGTVTDSDIVYINGYRVGETGYMYPPRYYPIMEGVLKSGRNTVAVRMDVKCGIGGFTKGRRYCIKSGVRTIELAGEWKFAVSAKAEPLEPAAFFQGLPLALYSDMMSPAMNIKCAAFIWYQGETNCGRAELYRQMFADFLEFYRRQCGYEIPVIYTQLCNFEGMCTLDAEQSWAKFRQAQLDCLQISNTAMAVTLDAGEYNDLHPIDKRTVGKRLAVRAGELLYGDITSFAVCVSAKAAVTDGGTEITLEFNGNVYLKNDRAGAFEVVFEDGIFTCDEYAPNKCGKVLRIFCDHKGTARSVRYAWRSSPYELDLYDLTMSPLSTFEIKLRIDN